MGDYTVRRTPDHEDLVTATDSEVLCRVVGRWVGQGGKTSLANTADADILEYILAKLAARIAAKSRTFLIKVKAHRGEPLIGNVHCAQIPALKELPLSAHRIYCRGLGIAYRECPLPRFHLLQHVNAKRDSIHCKTRQ